MAQLLTIAPASRLTFRELFIEVVTSILTLITVFPEEVCCKLKATAPCRCCLWRYSGSIEAGDAMEVFLCL